MARKSGPLIFGFWFLLCLFHSMCRNSVLKRKNSICMILMQCQLNKMASDCRKNTERKRFFVSFTKWLYYLNNSHIKVPILLKINENGQSIKSQINTVSYMKLSEMKAIANLVTSNRDAMEVLRKPIRIARFASKVYKSIQYIWIARNCPRA